ncbi:Hypothetical protein FSTVST1_449 [Faustovirus ST1]|nr:Hypothetical protein FSTVST1_449 [Faustovirus ST1]
MALVNYFEVLPIEIWREIGTSQWSTYVAALKVNKTLNELLKQVDVKKQFTIYHDKRTCERRPGSFGWILPDNKWFIEHLIMTPYEVQIYKKKELVKKIKYSTINHYQLGCMYYKFIEIIRYHYTGPNSMLMECVAFDDIGIKRITRSKWLGNTELARDDYNALTGMMTITGENSTLIRHGAAWSITHPEFFIFNHT